MSKNVLESKSQTFDLEKNESDYINVLKVLYSTPRLYGDLYEALAQKIPTFKKIVRKLCEQGFVDFQEGVVIDTITGNIADKTSKPVKRYILSTKGRKKLSKYKEDLAHMDEDFKKVDIGQKIKLVSILEHLDLQPPHSRYGLSTAHLLILVDMNSRTLRWWLESLLDKEFLVLLEDKFSDTRMLIPPHYRIKRELSKQLEIVVKSISGDRNLTLLSTLHTKRTKYLDDIKVARVGINGATDYEHDIDAQRIMAKIVLSKKFAMSSFFDIEPRVSLTALRNSDGDYNFTDSGRSVVFYQPDALYKERSGGAGVTYSFLEYERFQTRKDGWDHIEKFVGFMYLKTLPFESGTLRFVVDGVPRQRVYVRLMEAFADSVLDHPFLLPRNPLSIKVTNIKSILDSSDALEDDIWYTVDLPSGQSSEPKPVLHSGTSPYASYFSRGRQWDA